MAKKAVSSSQNQKQLYDFPTFQKTIAQSKWPSTSGEDEEFNYGALHMLQMRTTARNILNDCWGKKVKRFPWLLVLGGVAAAATVTTGVIVIKNRRKSDD